MEDLKVGAPIACEDYEDDWNDFSESTEEPSSSSSSSNSSNPNNSTTNCQLENGNHQQNNNFINNGDVKNRNGEMASSCNSEDLSSFMDSFMERGKSGSLENLVNTFDKTLSECFGDYKNNVSKIAPVQVRSQEEIINGCQ